MAAARRFRQASAAPQVCRDLPDGTYLAGVSPDCSMFLAWVSCWAELRQCPGPAEIDSWQLRAPGVDWANQIVWDYEGDGYDLVVRPFDGFVGCRDVHPVRLTDEDQPAATHRTPEQVDRAEDPRADPGSPEA